MAIASMFSTTALAVSISLCLTEVHIHFSFFDDVSNIFYCSNSLSAIQTKFNDTLVTLPFIEHHFGVIFQQIMLGTIRFIYMCTTSVIVIIPSWQQIHKTIRHLNMFETWLTSTTPKWLWSGTTTEKFLKECIQRLDQEIFSDLINMLTIMHRL